MKLVSCLIGGLFFLVGDYRLLGSDKTWSRTNARTTESSETSINFTFQETTFEIGVVRSSHLAEFFRFTTEQDELQKLQHK
jgi:hypothetical protein